MCSTSYLVLVGQIVSFCEDQVCFYYFFCEVLVGLGIFFCQVFDVLWGGY